jgi:hypothetical protein
VDDAMLNTFNNLAFHMKVLAVDQSFNLNSRVVNNNINNNNYNNYNNSAKRIVFDIVLYEITLARSNCNVQTQTQEEADLPAVVDDDRDHQTGM